jgi:hypothetical protein
MSPLLLEAAYFLVVLRPFLRRHFGSRCGIRHVERDDKQNSYDSNDD